MKTTILIDNNAPEGLACEWGFSALIEMDANEVPRSSSEFSKSNAPQDSGEPVKVLLDAGTTGAFADNAMKLGIDLTDVDFAVLSHAHFDHADGFGAFFAANDHAPLLVQQSCDETCYSDAEGDTAYIGPQRRMLAEYADRIERVSGTHQFAPGFWLIGHDAEHAEKTSYDPHMFVLKRNASEADLPSPDQLTRDHFMHEQSLVVEAPSGLVVFNSCSHSGIELIINEVRECFPDRPISAYVGGLHLFTRTDEEVEKVADMIEQLDIQRVYTGHCTGERAVAILRERLGDKLLTFESGLEILS